MSELSLSNVAVFLGPSLEQREAKAILPADYFPPIKRGDLPKAINKGYETLVIIDGEFGQSLSVSVIEIRQALQEGKRIWGASSMGALRAVECRQLGMTGVGWVYEAYRNYALEADDEVALLFNPVNLKPVTMPKVNLRWAIECALAHDKISKEQADELNHVLSNMHYQELTLGSFSSRARKHGNKTAVEQLEQWVLENPRLADRKKLDAIELLQAVKQYCGE